MLLLNNTCNVLTGALVNPKSDTSISVLNLYCNFALLKVALQHFMN